MKQVNFTHSGGFPLEQETLERLQTAYRSELYEALKKHLSIEPNNNYIVASATPNSKGWAIIHQDETDEDGNAAGILYPIESGTPTRYLETTRQATNLIYGDGSSQTAYYDYKAAYVDVLGNPVRNDSETVLYYDLNGFQIVKDLKAIEDILASIDADIAAIKANIAAVEGNIDAIETNIDAIETNIDAVEADIKQNYLPINGSKAMEGNLSLGSHQLYLNSLNTGTSNDLLVLDGAQVVKNDTIIQSLMDRILVLESKPASAVPIGMVAIWGKPRPFPEGWEEYTPLRGRMPIGVDKNDYLFSTELNYGGSKTKTLDINEIPPHNHGFRAYVQSGSNDGSGGEAAGKFEDGITYSAGGGQSFSILNPYSVVHFIVYTGKPSDKTAPTSVTGLTASNITNKTLTLTWTKSTDNEAVTKYHVFKNGSYLADTGTSLFYNAYGLTPGVEYSFHIVAFDAAENASINNEILKVTTTNVTAPVYINAYVNDDEKEVVIEWDFDNRTGPAPMYELERKTGSSTLWSTIETTSALSYIDNGTNFNTTYAYRVRAVDNGNYSAYTDPVSVTTFPRDISCFDVESLVTMASGQSKKLKNVVVGDKLHGLTFPNEIDESEGDYMLWNGKLSEAVKAEVTVVNKITSIQPDYFEIKTADNAIKVTGEHPLLVTEDGENVKWVSTKNVLETMFLIDKTGKTKAIESIIFKEEPLEVALLDVENVDNYIISGIAAHNNKPLDPPVNP